MSYVLILGANSDLGKVLAEKYAFEGYNLYLADNNVEELEETKQYINEICEIQVQVFKFNVLEFYTHRNFYKSLDPLPDVVITAINYLGDQKRAQKDFLEAKRIIDTNYTGLVSILNIVARSFEERKSGFIVTVGSIAGEQNKNIQYTYSGAKQGLAEFMNGLKQRLSKSNVHVLIANPGFVHTKETKDMDVADQFITIPGDIADEIFNAQQKGKETIEPKKNFGQKIISLFGRG